MQPHASPLQRDEYPIKTWFQLCYNPSPLAKKYVI